MLVFFLASERGRGNDSAFHHKNLEALQFIELVDERGLVPEWTTTRRPKFPPDLVELHKAPFSLQVNQ